MKYGLTQAAIEKICAVFAQFPEIEKAVLYGSRAKGNFKTGSDIDLTLFGENLTSSQTGEIAEALDDLLLPYTIDLSLYAELNHAKLQEHIDRIGVVFYERGSVGEYQGSAMKKGWQTKTLGDMCEVMNGGTPKTGVREYWGGKNLWITPAEMGKRLSPYVDDTERKITDLGLRDSSARMLPANSVILSSRAPIGHLVINTKPMSTNQGCKGLVPGSHLQPKFLYYYLSSIVDLLNSLGTGATFKELSGGKLKEVTLPVPPLAEQQRIVGLLDEAFEGIATAKTNAEKNLQNARALFESHLQSVFTQKGTGWVETTLGDVIEIVGGSQPPKSVFSKTKKADNVRLIQIRDYKSDKHIVFIPRAQARRFCNADDVMIGRYGPPLFQILRGIEGAYNVALMKAVPDEEKLSRDFLFYFLKHSAILQYVIYHSSRAAGQIGVTKETLEPYPIALPSLAIQKTVVETITELEAETQRLARLYEQKLAALDSLKKSLLHQAFNGEL